MTITKNIVFYTSILLISFANINGQVSLVSNKYIESAEEFKKKMKPDSAIIYYYKASVEFQKLGNLEKFVDTHNQIGIILTRQDKYDEAHNYLKKALSVGLSSLDSTNLVIATTYISLGVVYNAEQNYYASLISHHKALAIRLEKLGQYNAEVATSYGNIGNVYRNNKEFDKSIEAHSRAMKIREKIFGISSSEIIESYVGLGNAYREKKEYNASLEYFERALKNKIIQRGEEHKDLVKFYIYISDVNYLMENKEKADEYKIKGEAIENKLKQ